MSSYVYIYLDPRKPGKYVYGDYVFEYEPFYVGKGSGGRMMNHMQPSKLELNIPKSIRINEILQDNKTPIVKKVVDNIDSKNAYFIEGFLLNTIGKEINNNGPLLNIMGANFNGTHRHSEETKKLISIAGKNRKQISEKTRLKLKMSKLGKNNPQYKDGKTCGLCYRKRLSRSQSKMGDKNPMYGKQISDEERLRRSLNSPRRRSYLITYKDGNTEIITGLLKYCRDHNISCRCLRRVLYGKRRHYLGMTIKEI